MDKPAFNPAAWAHKGATAQPTAPPEKLAFNPAAAAEKANAAKQAEIALVNLPAGPVAAWSFSALTRFEDCPYAIYLSKVEKAPDPSGPAADRGSAIHKECEDYIQGELSEQTPNMAKFTDLIDSVRASYEAGEVEIEQDWAFNREWSVTGWTAADCWARVKLDVMHHESETCGHIYDWKTGRKFGNEVKHSQQLQLYAIAAFVRYPQLQFVKGEMIYLDKGERLAMEYTREQALLFKPQWERRALRMTTETEFKPKPSRHACRWCAHGKVQEGYDEPVCKWRVEG